MFYYNYLYFIGDKLSNSILYWIGNKKNIQFYKIILLLEKENCKVQRNDYACEEIHDFAYDGNNFRIEINNKYIFTRQWIKHIDEIIPKTCTTVSQFINILYKYKTGIAIKEGTI